MLHFDPRAWHRLPEAAPDAARLLDGTMTSVHEHLTCYGHRMTWAEHPATGGYRGTCSGCTGRVTVALDGSGVPRVLAGALLAPGTGDFAECPPVPAYSRFH